MKAHAVLGDVPEGVVQRLHARPAPRAALGQAQARLEDPVRHQPRVVDLEQEARVDDGPVLLAHRLGDGEEILLLGLVVGVPVPVLDVRGRDGGDEDLGGARAGKCYSQVPEVGLQQRVPLVGDRAGAREVRGRRAGARQHAAEPVVELGE